MSDWPFLERHRVTKPTPYVDNRYISDSTWGFNGLFRLPHEGEIVRCVASDGRDFDDPACKWQHVSVSVELDKHPPKWALMCWVKDLFWESHDWVVQFHPAKSEYVNYHPGCLHLWRPLAATMPTPLALMVGTKKGMRTT